MSSHEGLRRMPSALNIATSKLETEAAIDSMEKDIHNLFDVPVPIEDWEVVTGKIRSDKAKGVIVVVCVGALWSLPCRVHFSNWGTAATDPRMPKGDVQVHFVDHETRRGSSISSGVPIGLPVTIVYYNGKPIKFTESSRDGAGSLFMTGVNGPDVGGPAGPGVSSKVSEGSSCIVKMFSVDDCISLVTAIKERVSLISPMSSASSKSSSTTSSSMLPVASVISSVTGAHKSRQAATTTPSMSAAAASVVVVGSTASRMGQVTKGKQQVRTGNTSFAALPLHSDEEVVVCLNF